MFCNLFVADFEVALIVYVEIFLFDLVVHFFSSHFRFFLSVSCFFLLSRFLDICLESSFSFLSNCFCMTCISAF